MGGKIYKNSYQNVTNSFLSNQNPMKKENILKTRVILESYKDYFAWSRSMIQLKKLQHQFLLVPISHNIIERQICTEKLLVEVSNKITQIEYESYQNLLCEQIDRRNKVSTYFQQSEMWYLVFVLASTFYNCYWLDKKVGNIQPSKVLINDSGKLKIFSELAIFGDNKIQSQISQKKPAYLAPEQLQNLKKGHKISHYDYIATQSFSIGLTILSAGLLKNVQEIFNFDKYEINYNVLNQFICSWKQLTFYSSRSQKMVTYNPILVNLVLDMIKIDQAKRLTSFQVYHKLKPFEVQIKQMKPFLIDNFFHIERLHTQKNQQKNELKIINLKSRKIRTKELSLRENQKKSQKLEMHSTNFKDQKFGHQSIYSVSLSKKQALSLKQKSDNTNHHLNLLLCKKADQIHVESKK